MHLFLFIHPLHARNNISFTLAISSCEAASAWQEAIRLLRRPSRGRLAGFSWKKTGGKRMKPPDFKCFFVILCDVG